MEPINEQLERVLNPNAQGPELPVKLSPVSGQLSKRQAVILILIQTTRRRAAMGLMEDGEELDIEISAWEAAVEIVPNTYLARAWQRACQSHDWTWPFRPDFVADAYRNLAMEERRQNESLRRASGEINCEHCSDLGYQPIWQWRVKPDRWYLAQRPCSCDTAPAAQRSESPLRPPESVKGARTGNWVRLADLLQHGVPETAPADDYVIM